MPTVGLSGPSVRPPGRALFSAAQIQQRVGVLARSIREHYGKRPVTVIGLMNSSIFFLVDLLRQLPPDMQVECWRIESYQGTRSSGKVRGLGQYRKSFEGRHVLVVDDILDTGLTLFEVRRHLQKLGARSVRICVLLSKERVRDREVTADWVGFRIPNQFVIGYGLDYQGMFRSLPCIRQTTQDELEFWCRRNLDFHSGDL